MNREAIIRAAYCAVLAVEQSPTQRAVQAMTKRICGKQFRTCEVVAVLREIKESSAA